MNTLFEIEDCLAIRKVELFNWKKFISYSGIFGIELWNNDILLLHAISNAGFGNSTDGQ